MTTTITPATTTIQNLIREYGMVGYTVLPATQINILTDLHNLVFDYPEAHALIEALLFNRMDLARQLQAGEIAPESFRWGGIETTKALRAAWSVAIGVEHQDWNEQQRGAFYSAITP